MKFPKGLIIAFEGLDCSFKETNCINFFRRIQDEFSESSKNIFYESFPRYGNWSTKAVEKWLNGSIDRNSIMKFPRAIDSLYSIDRFFYWYEKFDDGSRRIDNLNNNSMFIFDRYNSSNAIYNPIYGDMPTIEDFCFDKDTFNIPNPDIVVWMRMHNFDTLLQIISNKKNRDQNEMDIDFLHNVWERSEYAIFENLFQRSGSELVIVECLDRSCNIKSKETLANEVYRGVEKAVSIILKERETNI